jgi:hypothetical protein
MAPPAPGVLVIGGGLAGALLALALREQGAPVTVVDPPPATAGTAAVQSATAISYGALPGWPLAPTPLARLAAGASRRWRRLQRQHGDLGWRPRRLRLHGGLAGLEAASAWWPLPFAQVDSAVLAAGLPRVLAAATVVAADLEALAAMAERLVAARRFEEALELIGLARGADAGEPAVWTAEGSYRLGRGEWAQAVAAADKALALDKRYAAAQAVKAQGLYFSKRYEEAYVLSRQLLEGSPEDPVMLFAHAKIAHEVRALEEEVEVLRRLIGFAERETRSSSSYRVYLGQAWAMRGAGEEALAELDAALADPELPPDQVDFARSARGRVELKVHPAAPPQPGERQPLK